MNKRPGTGALMAALKALDRFYYTPYCAVCDEAVRPPLPSPWVCRECLCRLPFRMGAERVEWPGDFPLFASFFYQDALPRLIVSMKFSGRTDRARALAPFLARTVHRQGLAADAILPVPLHPKREAERGYNQAQVLACGLSESLALPLAGRLLARRRFTARQSETCSARERRSQLQGAFCLDPANSALIDALRGRTVFLLDDVLTTGATLMEAAKPLRAAGIRVTGLVVATDRGRFLSYSAACEPW